MSWYGHITAISLLPISILMLGFLCFSLSIRFFYAFSTLLFPTFLLSDVLPCLPFFPCNVSHVSFFCFPIFVLWAHLASLPHVQLLQDIQLLSMCSGDCCTIIAIPLHHNLVEFHLPYLPSGLPFVSLSSKPYVSLLILLLSTVTHSVV